MVSCTVSRPGRVTTLMRAKTEDVRRQKTKIRRAFMSVARRLVALDVDAVVGERDDRLFVTGRFFRQREVILEGEGVLLFELVRAFPEFPVAGNVFDDHKAGVLLLEIL